MCHHRPDKFLILLFNFVDMQQVLAFLECSQLHYALIPSRFLRVNTQFFNESFFSIWCTLLTFFSLYDSVIFLLSSVFFP